VALWQLCGQKDFYDITLLFKAHSVFSEMPKYRNVWAFTKATYKT